MYSEGSENRAELSVEPKVSVPQVIGEAIDEALDSDGNLFHPTF